MRELIKIAQQTYKDHFNDQFKRQFREQTRVAMNRILALFKKDNGGEITYPLELEKSYRILKKVLGVGTFAVVKECVDKRTGQSYALKVLAKKAIKGKENMLTTELDVLKQVNHPNIVQLHDLYESNEGVYIITDLASGGELFNQLLLKGSYTEQDAANLVKQILEGVAYLHDHEIVHRDLKPENLLFKDKSDDSKLMITDFGLSKILKTDNDVLMTACGTPGYVAPEVLLQTGHGKPVDIWSIGVITYTLLCGYTPFWGDDQATLFENIMSGVYDYDEDYWSEISMKATDFIDRMLTFDQSKRVTAHEALNDEWFKSAADVDILENVRRNFSAKATFRKAINLVQGVNRMTRMRKHLKHGDENNVETGDRQLLKETEPEKEK
ncbi:10720_t:CDS:2 [Funneliformis caledonium]|uniref:10720_t:CDS:1 n=1 Tax=Funneliformis caledonium TaxID=1117310 RepID=A0A9N9BQU7_9GLOM|nr:10720_t:CDS:2 [Funneliformis caledonium]